jgi:hypothetical protein
VTAAPLIEPAGRPYLPDEDRTGGECPRCVGGAAGLARRLTLESGHKVPERHLDLLPRPRANGQRTTLQLTLPDHHGERDPFPLYVPDLLAQLGVAVVDVDPERDPAGDLATLAREGSSPPKGCPIRWLSTAGGTMPKDVLGRPVVTAEQMDAMTPTQRREVLLSRVVWDLSELPQDVAAGVRAKGEALVAELERPGGERSAQAS